MRPDGLPSRKELIRLASVCLSDPENASHWGTGFFVTKNLLVTCWHVVRDCPGQRVRVLQSDATGAASVFLGHAQLLERGNPQDLVLLLFEPDRTAPHDVDVVVLPLQEGEPADGAQFFVGAFPEDAAGWHEADYDFPGTTTYGEPPLRYLRLRADGVVPGFSGAALIDKARWWVCGVVSRNDLPGGARDGGLAVPMAQVCSAFSVHGEELLRRNRQEAHRQLLEPLTPPVRNAPPRILTTIDPSPAVTGVLGREEELKDLAVLMGPPGNDSHVVVHGVSGVGKSELLREYARRHANRYSGGRYWINCSLGIPDELVRIGRQCWGLEGLEGTPVEQAKQVLRQLAAEPVLLIYDNATSQEGLAESLPPAGRAHVLVSSVSRDWGPPLFHEWSPDGLALLSPQSGKALVEAIAGADATAQVGEQLLAMAGGLPMQIIPSAQALRRLARNGRLSQADFRITQDAENSFSLPWSLLDSTAHLLLQAAAGLNTDAMVESELLRPLADALGGQRRVEEALDDCRDLHLIEGIASLRMHQLWATFVAAQPSETAANGTTLHQLRRLQAEAMVEAARAVTENPSDRVVIDRFLSYPLGCERWADSAEAIMADGFHSIGDGLYQLGRFSLALPWFHEAKDAKRQGDLNGRVNHPSLGVTLHEIGNCFYQQGQWQEAAGWYEQAQAEKRQGDLHGRVDHESFGTTLHCIGNCLYQQGQWQEAAGWYEQAQAEDRQGDLHGRVDHQSLGVTLQCIGNCFSQQGQWQEAAGWYEQAQVEKRQGNLHGRVDHQSLGSTLQCIGNSFYQQGQWQEAAGWYEQAQAEDRQGDLHGRVDHESLGTTLQCIGNCFYQQGQWQEAAGWYEQAQAEKRQGNLHGRVDHQSLGVTLQWIGNCFSQQGQWQEAAGWYEQAQAEARQGDLHGRVDHESLGVTLQCIGNCFYQQGQWQEAAGWYEQAQVEKRQGNLHGRVDHQSLGSTLQCIGNYFYQQGQWQEAAGWYEQAQAEKRQGDVYGRVNKQSLVLSLQSLAQALSFLGQEEEAKRWKDEADQIEKE